VPSCLSSAIKTCPALIFPSNCFVGIHPTCFVCSFCNESRNGTSLNTPSRIETFTLGNATRGAADEDETINWDMAYQNAKSDIYRQ